MTKIDILRVENYLEHILEAVSRIYEYTEDLIELTFIENRLVQDAVIRNFEIIGEASHNIEKHHPDFLNKNEDLRLRIAYEMRNALAHGYYKIDLEVLWQTIEKDLPKFQQQIQTVYDQINSKN